MISHFIIVLEFFPLVFLSIDIIPIYFPGVGIIGKKNILFYRIQIFSLVNNWALRSVYRINAIFQAFIKLNKMTSKISPQNAIRVDVFNFKICFVAFMARINHVSIFFFMLVPFFSNCLDIFHSYFSFPSIIFPSIINK